MKILVVLGLQLVLLGTCFADAQDMNDPNRMLLPSPYPVYTFQGNGVINNDQPGTQRKLLPTDNRYKLYPGCYIACYSHTPGVYPVAKDIYVMGQIRVEGVYAQRICQPEGFSQQDISASAKFKLLCSERIPACSGIACWAGGDTGGWFGIQAF